MSRARALAAALALWTLCLPASAVAAPTATLIQPERLGARSMRCATPDMTRIVHDWRENWREATLRATQTYV